MESPPPLFSVFPEPACLIGFDGYVRALNPAFTETFGYAHDSVQSYRDFVASEDIEAVDREVVRVISTRSVSHIETGLRSFSGEMKRVYWSLAREEGAERVLMTGRDVTAAAQSRALLARSEANLRSLVGLLPVGVCVHREGRIAYANEVLCQWLGRSRPEELVDKHLGDGFLHPNDVPRVIEQFQQTDVSHELGTPILVRCTTVDGDVVVLECHASRIPYGGSMAHTAVFRQTEDSARRRLLDHLIATQDSERRRIARDLHDETGQWITSLIAELAALEQKISEDEHRADIKRIRSLTELTLDEVGRIAKGLHPASLERAGLAATLRQLVADAEQRHGLTTQLEIAEFPSLRADQELGVYRIVQEALNNVVKHANARALRVSAEIVGNELTICVQDDGKGMPDLLAESALRGLGMVGMRERASVIGGRLIVRSRPEGGTEIQLRVAVSDE